MGKRNNKNSFSLETIKRLSLYLRNLKSLKEQGIDIVSSRKLTAFLNITPDQFRKDLSFFGGFGKRGVGYNVEKLTEEIENILGVNKERGIVIVGVGKLGTALMGFEGFSKFNIKITSAFDVDKDKVGKEKKGVKIDHINDIGDIVKKNNIKIAIISTPPAVAQEVTERLVSSGIKGTLNFAPIVLKV
ncbi:MAG: redox-sensing transcriptional repressor Rex, partial [Candidatus Omnitrophica bacterium]|nr:redox-sensing transcriptional repressor Rex [Candidatus Omnitrophota bacterium]